MKTYFTSDFLEFFKELAANNHKDWFDQNRKRYEKEVKNPFKIFVGDAIAALRKEEPEILVEPKDCIFRINRDIRFSKDKTPYKMQVSAAIAPGGRKDMTHPGLYFELGPERVAIFGGVYMPDKNTLYGIRSYIANNLAEFKNAYSSKDFVAKFEALKGEQNKRIDKEFKAASATEPMLFNKQFYYMAELPPSLVTKPELLPTILAHHAAAEPVRTFFKKVLKI